VKRARVRPAFRAILMALFAGTADAQAAPTGMQGDVVFTDHSALSRQRGSGAPHAEPADLLQRLQDATRLVYVTGGRDSLVSGTSSLSACAF